jgi:hypothetical protein
VEDQHKRAPIFSARGSEMHRQTGRHDDIFAPCASDLLPLGRLQTGFASQRVPRLRAGVDMSWNGHARREYRLQEYHRVFFMCLDHKRPDFRDVLAAGSLPAFFCNSEQPNPSERLDDLERYQTAKKAAGRLSDILQEIVCNGASLRAYAARWRMHQSAAMGRLIAALDVLRDHYDAIDAPRKREHGGG